MKKLSADPQAFPIPEQLESLAMEALGQVRDSLDALTKSDADLARTVITGDSGIDRHYRSVIREIKQQIRRDPDRIDNWLRLINTARNLERIADHATNIADAVVYLKEGDAARQGDERRVKSK